MREYFGTEHWRRNRRLRPNSGGLQVPEHFDWMEVEKKERTQVKTADKEQESGDGSRLFEGFELQDGALVAAYLILATGTTDGADQLRDPVPDGRIGAMELQIGKNVSGQQIVRFHMPLVRDNLYVILRGVLVDQKLAGFTEEVHQITDGHVEPQGSATDLMETRKLDGFAMVALLMLARAIEEHGPLLSPDSGTDAQVTSVSVPSSLYTGQKYTTTVTVHANAAGEAVLLLTRDRGEAQSRTVTLRRGENTFAFDSACPPMIPAPRIPWLPANPPC